ncbi:MAG: cell division protein ZapA [Legionellales bacterium]|nr:cell division protein ZapA [Legionellales bacterium]
MSNEPINTITLLILDKPYQVKCGKTHMEELQKAAFHLDEKMREIKDMGHLKNLDHIMLMAALNIANEYLNCKENQNKAQPELNLRVQNLQKKLNDTLTANLDSIRL